MVARESMYMSCRRGGENVKIALSDQEGGRTWHCCLIHLSSLKTIWIHSSGPKIEKCSKHVDLMKEAKILLTSLLKILKQFF